MTESPVRLFVAVPFAEPLLTPLLAARPVASAAVRVEPAGNLHLTLHFLGARDLGAVAGALGAVDAASFPLRLDGLGSFEARDGDAVLWASVAGGEPLRALHEAIAVALAPIGYTPEARPWRPHITLARCPGSDPEIARFLAQPPPAGQQRVDRFALYSSHLADGRPEYRVEASYSLR